MRKSTLKTYLMKEIAKVEELGIVLEEIEEVSSKYIFEDKFEGE